LANLSMLNSPKSAYYAPIVPNYVQFPVLHSPKSAE
jgi:hypothetical protein